jgi:hypothetical protein
MSQIPDVVPGPRSHAPHACKRHIAPHLPLTFVPLASGRLPITMCRTYGAPHFTHHQSQGFRPGLAYAAPTALGTNRATLRVLFCCNLRSEAIFGFCTARHQSLLHRAPQIAFASLTANRHCANPHRAHCTSAVGAKHT